MSPQLILSLFPGIGLLDMAFEEEGFCVVRGPDLLWGGDIRRFHPPAGKFDGVIGGAPCQEFSVLQRIYKNNGASSRHGNLIPEFERCVSEAQAEWYVMENVVGAPLPAIWGYEVRDRLVRDVWVGGVTNRLRRFTMGVALHGAEYSFRAPGFEVEQLALHDPRATASDYRQPARPVVRADSEIKDARRWDAAKAPDVLRRSPRCAKDKGLPIGWPGEDHPFTAAGLRQMIGNGVPLPMGRAVARAVKRALGIEVASG